MTRLAEITPRILPALAHSGTRPRQRISENCLGRNQMSRESEKDMTEEKATHTISPLPATAVKAVRLENFRDPDWRSFLTMRLAKRYPACRILSRQPYVTVVELRTSTPWSKADENFFAAMKEEGFFHRWELLTELPPAPKSNQAIYQHIGYRVGAGERLTPAQQSTLLSQLHDLEERAVHAEKEAAEYRVRAEQAEEHATEMATTYNEIIEYLGQELRVKVYHQGEAWIAEDAETGKILLRDVALPVLYRKALRLRLEAGR